MGLYLTAVSVGEGNVPVRVDDDDAGEGKEYSFESDHYACGVISTGLVVSPNADIPFTRDCEFDI